MISVTVLTKNSERHLKEVLASLAQFDEVVVVDTGSTDHTIAIAKGFENVRLYERPFIGFGPTHNIASALARHEWILSIDSDEIVTDALRNEILSLPLDAGCVYSFWRKNYYHNRHIRGCGWYPDQVIRLYNRTKTSFSDALVHESVRAEGFRTVPLSAPVLHYPYECVADFLVKMNAYTTLFAEQNPRKKASIPRAILHALFAFFKTYLLKCGFLLGAEGFEIAWFNMNCAFYKYAKLRERRRR
jgi:glycosyltransferase involved in cell wall biosynthesis